MSRVVSSRSGVLYGVPIHVQKPRSQPKLMPDMVTFKAMIYLSSPSRIRPAPPMQKYSVTDRMLIASACASLSNGINKKKMLLGHDPKYSKRFLQEGCLCDQQNL
uniref:Ovule protein n=1 Tax=Ascaris lumbricoides TaxID=6252 RepID=A0A0M3I1L5_ASCLU